MTLHKKKILLLCHGNKHTFNFCPIPVSRKMLKYIVTLDYNSHCSPDILENFAKPTKIEKNSIDFISAIYYPQNLLVSSSGTLQKNHFIKNIIKILKIGGYYILTMLPKIGFDNFCKYLLTQNGQRFLIHIKKFRIANNILAKNINELDIEDEIIINNIFGNYVQFHYPKLKLLKTTNQREKYRQKFIQDFVEPSDSLDKMSKERDFFVEHGMQIFVKVEN